MPNKPAFKKQFLSEAYTFEQAAGFLIRHVKPPNRAAVDVAATIVGSSLVALKDRYLDLIAKNYQPGERGTPEQMKYNNSRHKIKVDFERFRQGLYRKLERNVFGYSRTV